MRKRDVHFPNPSKCFIPTSSMVSKMPGGFCSANPDSAMVLGVDIPVQEEDGDLLTSRKATSVFQAPLSVLIKRHHMQTGLVYCKDFTGPNDRN